MTGKARLQSNFKMKTHQSFETYEPLTFILNYKIYGFLTDGTLHSKGAPNFHQGVMKTQLFANILKAALAPFFPI